VVDLIRKLGSSVTDLKILIKKVKVALAV